MLHDNVVHIGAIKSEKCSPDVVAARCVAALVCTRLVEAIHTVSVAPNAIKPIQNNVREAAAREEESEDALTVLEAYDLKFLPIQWQIFSPPF